MTSKTQPISKIGIIGAGNIGATLAKLFSQAGYAVAISNSRGPETLQDLSAAIGPNAQALSVAAAARFGDIVIEAIPFKHLDALPKEAIGNKIFITAANYYPGRDGEIDLQGMSQSQYFTRNLSDARVVKAFNTIWQRHLATQGNIEKPLAERRAIFVAGDDSDAKAAVSRLIEAIGFGPVDTGTLAESGIQEPGSAIFNTDISVRKGKKMLREQGR